MAETSGAGRRSAGLAASSGAGSPPLITPGQLHGIAGSGLARPVAGPGRGGAERRTRALSAPQRGPGPPSTTCKRRPHFHPLRRSGARIHGTDYVSWRARLARGVQVAGRGGLCPRRGAALRGAPDASALACRRQASLRLGAQGGTLSMRAGVVGGKGPRGRAGVEEGNDRLAWRAPQALSGRGGHAGQPDRLR
jgi:hypothetical protein